MGEGLLPIMTYAGKGYLFRFQVYERVGVSLVNGYERKGAVISVCEKDLKGP